MPETLDGQSFINMSLRPKHLEELSPQFSAFPRFSECLRIPDHDQSISGSREQNIETFRRVHEPDVVVRVAAGKTYDYYFTFLSLVVV